MRFLHPGRAWWFAALLVAMIAIRVRRRRRFGLASTSPSVFASAYRVSLPRYLPAAAFFAGLLLAGAALMDPVLPFRETEVSSRGLDIVIALDLSSSMEEQMDRRATGGAETPPPPTQDAAPGGVGRPR